MSANRQRLRLTLLQGFGMLGAPWVAHQPPALPANPRVLVIRPDHIGDVLFATPALRLLRQSMPQAHVACMVGPWSKAVLEHNPNLDELVLCEFPGFARKPKSGVWAPYRTLLAWAARLRSERYDLAVVLRYDHWWGALLTYLAGIPRRLGYDTAEGRPFLTQALPYTGLRHEVLQNLTLVEHALRYPADQRHAQEQAGTALSGAEPVPSDAHAAPQAPPAWAEDLALEYHVTQEDEQRIGSYLHAHGITPDRTVIAIHAGAGAPVKMWEPEAWAEVADELATRWNARIVLGGGPDELDLAWSVCAHMRSEPLMAAGRTSLGELAALFKRCRLVMGPDCGPLHLAVAMGAPTLHLYGPVDPLKFGPWGPSHRHIVLTPGRECVPCNRLDWSPEEMAEHSCVAQISVQAVAEAAQTLLEAGPSQPGIRGVPVLTV